MSLATHRRGITTTLVGALGLLSGLGFGASGDRRPSARPASAANVSVQPRFSRTFDVRHFQKGNVHTHTTLSDGGSSPEHTIAWYRSHGYQFLALTDHNLLSRPARYASLQHPGFVLISGEEITMTGKGRQVHVNGLCIKSRIPGGSFGSAAAALSNGIGAVRHQGGVALVNHPNFDWGLTAADVTDARDASLLEIASGHPYVRTAGDADHPSHEALWDIALEAGADFMGVGVDDEHHIDISSDPPATPGRAWISTFGDVTDSAAICSAMAQGQLYASTGVELRRIAVREREYEVDPVDAGASVVFIGTGGVEIARHSSLTRGPAVYVLRGDEGYVRARIELPDGKRAWTPAVRLVNSRARN
ncbi:MAG TPA: CehA/McbA family metallohydrolase [Polyangiaceae bacterium]|nr:CehA/McbA family metallohydrolase [Polyangiaceae bacterium]